MLFVFPEPGRPIWLVGDPLFLQDFGQTLKQMDQDERSKMRHVVGRVVMWHDYGEDFSWEAWRRAVARLANSKLKQMEPRPEAIIVMAGPETIKELAAVTKSAQVKTTMDWLESVCNLLWEKKKDDWERLPPLIWSHVTQPTEFPFMRDPSAGSKIFKKYIRQLDSKLIKSGYRVSTVQHLNLTGPLPREGGLMAQVADLYQLWHNLNYSIARAKLGTSSNRMVESGGDELEPDKTE